MGSVGQPEIGKKDRKGDNAQKRLAEYLKPHYFYPVKLKLLRLIKAGDYGNPF